MVFAWYGGSKAMNWLHVSLLAASLIEALSGFGTYLVSIVECATCIGHFLMASWSSIDGP
jgi:hypothetical protein